MQADMMRPGCPSEIFSVPKHNEENTLIEYRTRRLVLAAWDALALGELIGPTLSNILRFQFPFNTESKNCFRWICSLGFLRRDYFM
jgi:hypothetical protein